MAPGVSEFGPRAVVAVGRVGNQFVPGGNSGLLAPIDAKKMQSCRVVTNKRAQQMCQWGFLQIERIGLLNVLRGRPRQFHSLNDLGCSLRA